MNIAEMAVKKRVITWTLTILLPVMGYLAYRGLPRLEDPEFAIKQAVVLTPYPGASAGEVEAEVTEKIEKAVQELGQLKRVESYSERGLSRVKVVIKDNYDSKRLPQVWDELRRKVQDHQLVLPPGAGPSLVMDDFGDTYGVYFALTGRGFTMAEFKSVAELLKRELTTVTDVKKVVFFGVRQEAVHVEISKAKVKALGITLPKIMDALAVKNLPADAGRIKIGSEFMPIAPSGVFQSEKDFADLLVASQGGKLIYLKDVAAIHRGYEDPPQNILRVNGRPAVGIAISTVKGGNVVKMGRAVTRRVRELMPQIPLGMDLVMISDQAASVVKAIDGFIINLIEAVAIVVIVLLFFMGLRSGLIIGFILALTIAATFMVMGYFDITLERISLGALIIALGMLVDNAIVVVDGMKVHLQQGKDGMQAARKVIGQNAVPLLGATAVAILAFAAIGGMDNDTGEYCRALYYVILISLSLSWLTAVTSTPLLVTTFLKPKKDKTTANPNTTEDPYGGKIYVAYRRLLTAAIRYRWMTVGIVLALFIASLVGFGFIKNLFFPPSTRPQFLIEIQFREGIHILEAEQKVAEIEALLKNTSGVTTVASAIGDGHPRFLLTYDVPIDTGPHYSSILVSVSDYKTIDRIYHPLQNKLEEMFPDAAINVKKFNVGPGNGGKIQLRINGPDPAELRRMANRVKTIIAADPDSKAIRHEWGAKIKTIQPILAEERAIRAGIDRRMAATAFQTNYSGSMAGVYREGIELIPIYVRTPAKERRTVDDMADIPLISPITGKKIPALQIIDDLRTGFEDARLSRYNRRSMLKVHADARAGLPSDLLMRIKPKIEQALGVDTQSYSGREVSAENYTAGTIPVRCNDIIPLKDKPGYFIAWSGEAEDSAEATAQLGASIPIFFGLMVLTVIFLFNAVRQPLIIWLTVPLSIIGVTAGLLLFRQPFGFMALLGVMSLAGMLIKNAIVLVDQIEMEIRAGKPSYQAVVDSGVGRMMPVCMAAVTTIMGMAPLLQDDFFVSMAVTIMFGLGFATLLTLIVVPVLYVIFFRIPYEANLDAAKKEIYA
jgi:multidrug efflux pump subunit AcrB